MFSNKGMFLFFKKCVSFVFEDSLRQLFFHGPKLYGYGFWNGVTQADICADLTHTQAYLWQAAHAMECSVMTEKSFQSFYVCFQTWMYLYILYYLLSSARSYLLLRYQIHQIKGVLDRWVATPHKQEPKVQ